MNLLQPQLSRLADRCRLLVTSAFGAETTGVAVAAAADLRVQVRVLNPAGGTFHPKLYLTRRAASAVAVVGSANLASGLVANIETALVVAGRAGDQAIADCWRYAESLWAHPAAIDWREVAFPAAEEQFGPALLGMLRAAVPVLSWWPR